MTMTNNMYYTKQTIQSLAVANHNNSSLAKILSEDACMRIFRDAQFCECSAALMQKVYRTVHLLVD